MIEVIFYKEVLDNFRDSRALRTALLTPLLGPLLLTLLITAQIRTITDKTDQVLILPVAGIEYAPNLVSFLRQAGVKIQPGHRLESQVKEGIYDVALRIPAEYPKKFKQAQPAPIEIISDATRQGSQVSIQRVRDLLNSYSRQIGSLRLLSRGLNPQITQAITLEDIDVGSPQGRAVFILALMPYFIIFSAFVGGIYIAIDTTAGERERGSLEPLLITPVPRWQLVVGKLGAVLLFTTIAVAETIVGFAVLLSWVPVEELGLQINFEPLSLALIFLLILPVLLVAGAIQTIIATFTKSFREALTYLQLLPLIPAIPGLLLVFLPIKIQWWMMLIPTLGQQLLIQQLVRGEIPNLTFMVLATGSTLIVGVGLVSVAVWAFQQEAIFNS